MNTLRYLPQVSTLQYDSAKCNGCMICLQVCPHAVLARDNKQIQIVDRDACMECGACAGNCPEQALTVRSGVGCAYGILLGMIRGTEPTCGCGDDTTSCC